MPLWQIYHPESTFADVESKQALTNDITSMYTPRMPAFYVVVQFISMSPETFWVGGSSKTERPFIRIVISHVAITSKTTSEDEDAFFKRVTGLIDGVLQPHVEAKGYDWEYSVMETERRFWKINGLTPPPWQSEAEQEWIRANKPLPWEGDH